MNPWDSILGVKWCEYLACELVLGDVSHLDEVRLRDRPAMSHNKNKISKIK